MKSLVIGLKLLLLGKTESEGGGDPWPIVLPGEEKPISSSKIGEHVNSELIYYWKIYQNTKCSGPPLPSGWIEWPAWLPQLILHFDNAIESVRSYNEGQAYKLARLRHGGA